MPLPNPPLPSSFQFSQNNLQDFSACPRRFQLRHILRLAWPAVQTEPIIEQEKAIQRGMRFHQMAHQSYVGLSSNNLAEQTMDTELALWWQDFCEHPPIGLPEKHLPEFMLTAAFGAYRLVAKYDLLAYEPGAQFIIVDWKTNRKRPKRPYIQNRIQTRLYRFLLACGGAHLNSGTAIQPEQIQMLYWFTAEPTNPETFDYNLQEFEEDQFLLAQLVDQIDSLASSAQPFPLTSDEKSCAYCNYRSLCNRGVSAGAWTDETEMDIESEIEIEIEQIAEIAF